MAIICGLWFHLRYIFLKCITVNGCGFDTSCNVKETRWSDKWMGKWMGEGMNGWLNGWMDGWMDG